MKTHECLLEPVARLFRFKISLSFIVSNRKAVILDLGSGSDLRYYNFLKKSGLLFKNYIAVDPRLPKGKEPVTILRIHIEKKLPFKDSTVDYVVGFAFLEHIDYPREVLQEAIRILKPGGKIIFTAPTPKAKMLLEKILVNLKLISKREIREHKRYFNRETLLALIPKGDRKKINVYHRYFELGLNNLLVIEKI